MPLRWSFIIIAAMRRIGLKSIMVFNLLKNLSDNSYDCVYPMFEENITESDGIKGGLGEIDSLFLERFYEQMKKMKPFLFLFVVKK
jgi:hypothetical protein